MASPDVNAIGRLWDDQAAWFGIARAQAAAAPRGATESVPEPGYVLVFGDATGLARAPQVAAGDAARGVLLALIAFFEGDTPAPPPDLEMTQSGAADAVRWLAEAAAGNADALLEAPLRDALDGIDDGLPADVVTAFLYRSVEATAGGALAAGTAPLDELRRTYERLGR